MRTLRGALLIAAGVACAVPPSAAQDKPAEEVERRPRLSVRAQPNVAVAPSRIVLTAELVGGANDFQEYYCPTVEWEWGDDTSSESTLDCAPYEAGKSEIKRRFTVEHRFLRSGYFKVFVRLKQGSKNVANASVNVTLQPGPRETVR